MHAMPADRLGAVVLAGLVLCAAACSGGPGHSGTTATPSGQSGTGGGGNSSSGGGRGGTSGSFTIAFARCMRAHGVPGFPDPSGSGGQLGPFSGINPASPQFQAALNGPCRRLAPAAWLSSGGPGSVSGGS